MGAEERTMQDVLAELSTLQRRVAELEAVSQEIIALRTSEQELRELFSPITDLIFVLDREGRYLNIAPTAPELLYRPSAELLGKTVPEMLPAEVADACMASVRHVLDTRENMSMEYTLTIREKVVWFNGIIAPKSENTVLFVAHDITAYKRIQIEFQLHQEELIRMQAAALAELTTPLIPIHDQVVVMPLIGVLDARRSAQIMETLLDGIASRGAQVAILDITGIRALDAHSARSLVQAARAAELLGAQVVLTGIRPEVAEMLVELNTEMSGIVTCGTLQSGVAFAMSRRGERHRAVGEGRTLSKRQS